MYNPHHGVFAGVRSDRINRANLTSPQGPTGTCQKPSFQDHHTIGAIIAHGMERLLTDEVSDLSPQEQSKKKAEILLSWADKMGPIASQRSANSSLTLAMLIEPAIGILAAGNGLKQTQCQVLKDVFPIYAATWTAQYGCSGTKVRTILGTLEV